MADLLVAVFAWVAQQERRRLIERVVAGVRRAQANGKSGKAIGRPTREIDAEEVRLRRGRGQSIFMSQQHTNSEGLRSLHGLVMLRVLFAPGFP